MVCSGHYLATAAGYRILEQGGNAVDAGIAAGITINVVQPEDTNFGGVAPIMIYLAESNSVLTISGVGRWPKAASVEYFQRHCEGLIPPGISRAVVPSAPDAWLTALERYGTLRLEDVIAPALELAEEGYPITAVAQIDIAQDVEASELLPSNLEIFAPNGKVAAVGELVVQKDLANTFRRLIAAEKASSDLGRELAIRAARDCVYKGEIAEEIVDYFHQQGGLLTIEDLAAFSVGIESPIKGQFREYEIYSCGPWSQGPVVPQTLQLLSQDDFGSLHHNSADYIHLVSQALNLCFADREHFFGDPEFVDVPIDMLLSDDYTQARRQLVNMEHAFSDMAPHGKLNVRSSAHSIPRYPTSGNHSKVERDTSYTCVVDRWGNAFSATPSDSNTRNPMIPGLGFSVSGRGSQSWLDPHHPSRVEPWKRPRLTPNPALAFYLGKPFLVFGCPGGDAQCQAMTQCFLNIVEFGMDPQEAVEQPRFTSWNFPNSFWPHDHLPGRLRIERGIPSKVVEELANRGHDVEVIEDWDPMDMGVMSAIVIDPQSGVLSAGADPRRDTYAIGR